MKSWNNLYYRKVSNRHSLSISRCMPGMKQSFLYLW